MSVSIVKEGSVVTVGLGNGLKISHDLKGDEPVIISHDCDCNGGKPCCLTAVDWSDLTDALRAIGYDFGR